MSARRECRVTGALFDMYDLPSDLARSAGLKPEDLDFEQALFESVLEANGTTDGGDHVLLGHPGEHRDQEDRAKAALAERSGPVRPVNHDWVDPARVPEVERARFRLLLTMGFDAGFAPFGDDDLAAHRLDRAAPLIHLTG